MENLLRENREELISLNRELSECVKSLNSCEDDEEREQLSDERDAIQEDINDTESEINRLIELQKTKNNS